MPITMSTHFIGHVRTLYQLGLEQSISGRVVRQGINGYTHHAPPAYLSAVAAVEAVVNEALLSELPRVMLSTSSLWALPSEWVEKLDLPVKLVLVPEMLFGQSLSRGEAPLQDMVTLIKVRNELTHWKMKSTPPRFMASLDAAGVTLPRATNPEGVDYVWPDKLCSTEGIRWAHNTACATVHALARLSNSAFDGHWFLLENFKTITEDQVHTWFHERNIDPDSAHP